MKIIVNRQAFRDSLAFVGKVANGRVKPVLGGVLIVVTKDRVELRCTRLDVTLKANTAQVTVEAQGECLVDAGELLTAVSRFDEDTINLELDGSFLVVRGESAKLKLPTLTVADFPPEWRTTEGKTFAVSGERVKQAAKHLAPICAGGRFATAGVLVRADGAFVATNGSSLLIFIGSKVKSDEPAAVIPAEAMKLAAMLDGETISVTVAQSQATFETPEASLTTNLLEGTFAPYAEVIPDRTVAETMFTCLKDEFRATVERGAFASRYRQEGKDLIRNGIKFDVTEKSVSVTSEDSTAGEAESSLPIKVDGKPITVGFNPEHLVRAIDACDGDEVSVRLSHPRRPVRIEHNEIIGVVMPVNLQ
jgi:DNA polymerase III beta subunit